MASREINILIKAKDLASGAIKGVKSELGGLGKIGSKAGSNLARNFERGVIAAGAGVAGLTTIAVKTAIDFEDAFAGVRKTVEATDAEFEALFESFRKMSRTTPIEFEEFARIGEIAGALGIATDSIDEFALAISKGSVATGMTVDELADSMGRLGTILQLDQDDYETFVSTLVELGNKGASTEAEIVEIAKRFATTGKQAGLANHEILGLSSAISSLGVEPEAAGSSLSRMMTNFITETANGSKKAKEFARVAGVSFEEFAATVETDTLGAVMKFVGGLGELDKMSKFQALKDAGITNVRDRNAILAFADGIAEVNRQLGVAADEYGSVNAVNEEFRKRNETTAAQLTIVKNNLTDAAYTVGAELLPVIKDLTTEFVAWLQLDSTQAGIRKFAQEFAAHARETAAWLKSLDWNAIAGAVQAAAGAGKALLDAFLAMPPWVQGLLAGGFAVNKLTGGALGDLIGMVGKGVIKGVMNMNAGVVNINAATVNGGGGVPGAAGRAGGGFAGALGRGLVTGGVVGGAAALTAGAAVTVHNFEQMRGEQREKLQGILDELPRTPERIDRSIEAIREQISMERPLLEGVLFNTNIKPQLEAELQKLEEVKGNQLRAEIAIRDAIPWHQRNVEAVHNLNAQEGARHSHLTGLQQSQVAAVRAMHGPLSTIAAKNFSPRIAITTHVNSFVSVNEWQRVARSAQTSYSTNTGGI